VREILSKLAAATEGLSPNKIALIVAVGLVLGAFPVYGCPTILCGLAAVALRLNLPAIQLVNQMATPVQIALLIRWRERDRGYSDIVPDSAAPSGTPWPGGPASASRWECFSISRWDTCCVVALFTNRICSSRSGIS